jgi:uncharacterized membrane protein YfcA
MEAFEFLVEFTGIEFGKLIFIISIVALAGLVKGFSGFGAGSIMAPGLSIVISPLIAIPLIHVIDISIQLFFLRSVRHDVKWMSIFPMAVSAMLFIPIGVVFLNFVDPSITKQYISILVLFFALILAFGWKFKAHPELKAFVGVGSVSGFLSGSASLGGPPVVIFNLLQNVSHITARANIIAYFSLTGITTIISLYYGELLVMGVLKLGIISLPVYIVGIEIGKLFFGYASPVAFRRLAITIITLFGLAGLLL